MLYRKLVADSGRLYYYSFGTLSIFRQQSKTMAVAATDIASPSAHKNPKFTNIPDVKIDSHGKFKYILIKVHDPDKDREFKHIVRGSGKANYHADIYDDVVPEIENAGLDCECMGGGRIEHDSSKKKLSIYGHSQAYGQADHKITGALLDKKYKYQNISISYEGY
ncbi:14 kDa phosphohistidine phosphatase-like [Mytilus galloprovincialis]|uniref:14 kDa phosphohistidine phosphatase-like n=1 Tax=Mytilus edulis TaxID=6550 RepID=UPI0039F0D7D6